MDAATTDLFNKIFSAEIPQRNRQVAQEIQQVRQIFISTGNADSSRLALSLAGVLGKELLVRNKLALQQLVRVATMHGRALDSQFAEEANQLLTDVIRREADSLIGQHLGKGKYQDNALSAFEPYIAEALQLRSAQLEIQAAQTRLAQTSGYVAASTITVHGTVGIIQVGGSGNVAQATQIIDQQMKDAVREVLQKIAARLTELPDGVIDKDDVQSAVSDALVETQKEKPSQTKIKGLLTGIGDALQGVAAASDVYEALKGVLQWMGVSLP